MANVSLKKVTVVGLMSEKEKLVKSLQSFGSIHVIPLTESEKQLNERPEDYLEALRYLIMCPEHKTPLSTWEDSNPDDIVRRALDIKYEEKKVRNQRDKAKKYMRKIEGWGFFDFPEVDEIADYKFYFYKVPHYRRKALEKVPDLVYQEVYRSSLNTYIVVISKGSPDHAQIPGKRVPFKNNMSMKQASRHYEELCIKLEDLETARRRLTRYIHLLLQNLDHEEDEAIYNYQMDRTFDEDCYFIMQGWVPSDQVEDVVDLLDDYKDTAALYVDDPAPDDEPPTLFKNSKAFEPGEDLVAFYQMPSYKGWDPSLITYLSFAFFYAVIMSDAGYAMVQLVIMGLVWGKLGGSPTTKRVRKLGVLLSVTSVIYGIAVGSYFGMAPPAGTLLEKLNVLDSSNSDYMMLLSVTVGVIHIMIANLILAWHNRDSLFALSYLGWTSILGGAIGLGHFGTDSVECKYAMIGGALAVLLFSSRRPFNSVKDILMRVIDGLLGLTNVSKAFGDALSYLRLFALGLTSASLAMMFNTLAAQASEGMPGIGVVFAALILLFGHGLNFVLAIIGGVVHGLRLNLIEFFSWGVTEEGYLFKPFRLKEKKIWIH
ncbi:MAG: V-type ATP synthase subunit I [Alphaproteobacteria bacterium]